MASLVDEHGAPEGYHSTGSTEKGRHALGRFVVSEMDLYPPTIELNLFCTSKSLGRFLV